MNDFNLFILIMFWSACAIFLLAAALMVLLLVVRILAIARGRRIAKLVARWRGVFTAATRPTRHGLERRDAFTVLSLWNDFHRVRTDSEGISAEALAEIAREEQFERYAFDMLEKGDEGDKLVALTFVGYMKHADALPLVRALLDDSHGQISLAAFRALVQIDPTQTKTFAFAIGRHADWRLSTVEQILRDLGPGRISRPLAIAAEDATDEQLTRTLRFFILCEPGVARPTLLDALAFRLEPNVVAAALRALAPFTLAEDRPVIYRFLEHPADFVRIAAIGALVPVCAAGDRDVLLQLLRDPNSWVRYRAAQTLLDCFTGEDHIGDLERDAADRYAADALNQVLAERSVIELQRFVQEESDDDDASSRVVARRAIGEMRAGV